MEKSLTALLGGRKTVFGGGTGKMLELRVQAGGDRKQGGMIPTRET